MDNKLEILTQLASGIFGGTILGILGFLTMTTYGGNAGCFAWADSITGLAGYESCGIVGAVSGIIIGAILGTLRKTKAANRSLVIGPILAAFFLPFLFGIYILNLGDEGTIIAPAIIIPLVFIFASSIISSLILAIRNWQNVIAYTKANKKKTAIIVLASIAVIILAIISGILWNKEAKKQALTNPSRWETYTNDEYGFSLKFPEAFSYSILAIDDPYVNEGNSDIVFAGVIPDQLGLIFKVFKKPTHYTDLQNYVNQLVDKAKKDAKDAISPDITVNTAPAVLGGVQGYAIYGCDSYCANMTAYLLLEHGDYLYKIIYQYTPEDFLQRIASGNLPAQEKAELERNFLIDKDNYKLILAVLQTFQLWTPTIQLNDTAQSTTETYLPDITLGSQPAYLIDAYSKNGKNYIDVDYVEWLHGETSLKAQVEDGQCPNIHDCYDFPNGYKRNSNPLVRTLEVLKSAPIVVSGSIAWSINEADQTKLENPFGRSLAISFEKLADIVSKMSLPYPYTPPFKAPKTFVTIDVKENIVTKIVEPYQE